MDGLDFLAVRLLPGAHRVAREHRLAGQQPDNLCGAYWGATLLRSFAAADVDAEDLALLAGSVLPVGDPSAWVPRGAPNRLDYRLPLLVAERPEDAGTSAPGLIEAVRRASGGGFAMVPLRATWTAERVEAVVVLCEEHPAWEAIPVCNVRTGLLWGSHPALGDVLSFLAGHEVDPPEPDWDVGHFLSVAGVVRGPARPLLLLRDSYPVFGWDAYHLQPPSVLAAALERGDGREGGVLLFVASEHEEAVAGAARERGFLVDAWDNGTPWPASVDSQAEGGRNR